MRISAHSGAEEEELSKAATSSLHKAQEHLDTFICWSKSVLDPTKVLGTDLNIPREILSSLHKHHTTHSQSWQAQNESSSQMDPLFLGKIIGALRIPNAVLLDADFRSKLEGIWQGWCQDGFWRELSPEHLVSFFWEPKKLL